MSTFKCEVVKIEVAPHPNADKLELIKVRGWQCVSQKDLYKTGDLAIYLPVDSVLPPTLVEKLGIEKYYSKRLKTIRLRGSISQGMIMGLDVVKEVVGGLPLREGDDATTYLGITKYDPPIPVEMAGIQRKADSRFIRYTDIENFKNFNEVFKEGDSVIVTEKIHGTNFRAANIDGEIHVGSHNCNLIEAESNVYWRGAKLLDVKTKLEPGEQIFGEVHGAGIQDLAYGFKPGELDVRIFDVFKDNRFLSHPELVQFLAAKWWDNKLVPVLYIGEWNKECIALASGNSTLDATQIKEGVVVKPMMESFDQQLQGRKIVKIISDEYLIRRDSTERH